MSDFRKPRLTTPRKIAMMDIIVLFTKNAEYNKLCEINGLRYKLQLHFNQLTFAGSYGTLYKKLAKTRMHSSRMRQ